MSKIKLSILISTLLLGIQLSLTLPKNHQQPTPPPPIAPSPQNPMTKSVLYQNVPFTVQAPLGQWKDPLQQDACEEASSLMAVKWARSEKISNPQTARSEILDIANFQIKNFRESRDTSAADTLERIIYSYYQFPNATLIKGISIPDIVSQLQSGNLVITPMNGQALNNPYFTQPGPERHMVLIIGFDAQTQEFITNDPGIGRGKNYRYPINVFYKAIRDYQTGYHLPFLEDQKNMIIVSSMNQKQGSRKNM